MKNIKYNLASAVLLFIILSMTSCSDFFVKEIEIPRQQLDQQLVVHGFVSDIDTSITFTIAQNYTLEENIPSISETWIGNTMISIEKADGAIIILDENNKLYHKELEGPLGGAGQDFNIDIIHPDYDNAHIKTNMPKYVAPSVVKYLPDGGFTGPGGQGKQNAIAVVFQDPADEKNYYEIQVHEIVISSDTTEIGGMIIIKEKVYPDNYFIPNPNFVRGISGFMISDELFNGEEFSFKINLVSSTELEEIPLDRLKISWNCISRDHFEFSKSIVEHKRSTSFGLFSDPIAVFSNVENGLGIVSMRSSRQIKVTE